MASEDFDVVIIGSGAGGAPVASVLAQAGYRVLVLEKGPLLRTQDELPGGNPSPFKRDEMFNVGTERRIQIPGMDNTGAVFFSSPVEPDLNDEPHVYSEPGSDKRTVTIEGYTAQVVGGGTQLYGAVSLRFTPEDMALETFNAGRSSLGNDPDASALKYVIDWPVPYSVYERYYEKAEELIGLNGEPPPSLSTRTFHLQRPLAPNPISEYARAGMVKQHLTPFRTPLAVITEAHKPSGRPAPMPSGKTDSAAKSGFVNRYGDPMGYKSNTWVSLLRPQLMRQGPGEGPLVLRPNCHVTHLSAQGRRVTAVHYFDSSSRPRTATGKVVVAACSAIESVRLVMNSAEQDLVGLGRSVRYKDPGSMLGGFFLTHCFGGAEVTIDRDEVGGKEVALTFDKSISMDSDWATDGLADPTFLRDAGLWAGGMVYNNTSDQAQPVTLARNHGSGDLDTNWAPFMSESDLRGDRLIEWLDRDFGTRLSVSFMANQVPVRTNRIELSDVRDKWGRKVAHVIKRWHRHDQYLMGLFADRCRQILLDGCPVAVRRSIEAFEGLPEARKYPERFHYSAIESGSVYGNGVRIANHILGGMRFGRSRDESVLDPDCRFWDLDNLYVTDGSFMPTSGSGNPTLTIQANAFRVADVIKAKLGGGGGHAGI